MATGSVTTRMLYNPPERVEILEVTRASEVVALISN